MISQVVIYNTLSDHFDQQRSEHQQSERSSLQNRTFYKQWSSPSTDRDTVNYRSLWRDSLLSRRMFLSKYPSASSVSFLSSLMAVVSHCHCSREIQNDPHGVSLFGTKRLWQNTQSDFYIIIIGRPHCLFGDSSLGLCCCRQQQNRIPRNSWGAKKYSSRMRWWRWSLRLRQGVTSFHLVDTCWTLCVVYLICQECVVYLLLYLEIICLKFQVVRHRDEDTRSVQDGATEWSSSIETIVVGSFFLIKGIWYYDGLLINCLLWSTSQ